MSDVSDDESKDHVLNGPPLSNTLATTLSIFPLAESRCNRKRKRPSSPITDPSRDTEEKQLILHDILFPTDEDLLGDSLDRVTIERNPGLKRRKVGKKKQARAINVLNHRLARMLQSAPPVSARPLQPGARLATQLKHIFRTNLKTPAVKSGGKFGAKQRLCTAAIKTYSYMNPNAFGVRMVTPYQLFPYQVATVKWGVDLEDFVVRNKFYTDGTSGGILAMVMGLGKTPCAATMVARTLNQQRIERSCSLYVCPKNLLGTVRNEFEKFFGDQIKVMIYHREFLRSAYATFDERDIRKYDVVITNYASVVARMNSAGKFETSEEKSAAGAVDFSFRGAASAADRLLADTASPQDRAARAFADFPWFRIILDESQEIRERTTKRFKAMSMLMAPRRFCLTGTPIHNKIGDLFHQLEFTGLRLPRGTKYTKGNLKKLDLMKMVRFVEYKDATAVTLPPKHINKIFFNLSKEEQLLHSFYMRNAQLVFKEIETSSGRGKSRKTMEAHVSMIRVMQVCSAPYLITPGSKEDVSSEDALTVNPAVVFPTDNQIDQWIKVRDGPAGIGSSKMVCFANTMNQLQAEADEKNPLKVVVFANYTSTLRLSISAMQARDPNYDQKHVFVHGGVTSAHKREEMYTKFRMDPEVETLYMTLKLGSIGLNLSEANKVMMLEPWYSYSALHQAESRVHRIGQMRPVDVYYFMATESAEERVYRIAQSKKELAEDIANQRDFKLGMKEMEFILFDDMDIDATQ